MDTETQTQSAPASDNLSMEALAQRVAQRMNSSAASAGAAPQTAAQTPPAEQPTEEGAAAGSTENTPAEGDQLPADTGAEAGAAATDTTPTGDLPPVDEALGDEAAAEAEAQRPLPVAVKDLRKRVNKVVAQRNEARAEAERLKGEVQQLTQNLNTRESQPTNVRGAIDRFSGHPAVKNIEARLSQAEQTLDWCEVNADGGEMDIGNGKTISLTPEQVREMRKVADNDRIDLRTQRSVKVSELHGAEEARRKAADVRAAQVYPWMQNQQSPEFQMAVKIGMEIPGLIHSPEMILHMGDLVRGRMAREAEEKKRTTAPARRPAANPPNITTTTASAPRVDAEEAALKTAEEQYRKTGTMADYNKLTVLKLQLSDKRRKAA